MVCPQCRSSRVRHTSTVRTLDIEVWRCDDCATQFTVQPDRPGKAAGRRLILNVDDRPTALYARHRMLRARGFDVADASTGEAAWQDAVRLRPSAILLDVHLPDADGRDLCRRMRAHAGLRGIPVVLISATLRADEAPDLHACGAAGYVREPVTSDALAAVLRRALDGARR